MRAINIWICYLVIVAVAMVAVSFLKGHDSAPKRVLIDQEFSEYLRHSPFVGVQRKNIIEGSFD